MSWTVQNRRSLNRLKCSRPLEFCPGLEQFRQQHENRQFGRAGIDKEGEVEKVVGDTGIEPVASSV